MATTPQKPIKTVTVNYNDPAPGDTQRIQILNDVAGNVGELQFKGRSGNFSATNNLAWDGNSQTLNVRGSMRLTGNLLANIQGNPSYLKIIGGNVGDVLSTDGAGNLSWQTMQDAGGYGNTEVAAYLPIYTGNLKAGNLIFTNNTVQNTAWTGTVAVANVTGLGNIANINLTGSTSNVLYGNGVFGPVSVSNISRISNGLSTVNIPNANGDVSINSATTSNVEITTSSLTSVTAPCYIGLVNEYVADTEFNDDITVVQVGWTVIVNSVQYTVTSIDPSPPANQYRITVTGATFVSGTSYTFTNPVPVESTWYFDNTGNITLPSNIFAVNYANGEQVQIGGGNPFNQDLNTTDNVQFANVTSTDVIKFSNSGNIVGGLGYAPTYLSIESYQSNSVNITTNDIYTWSFGSDGNLVLPGNTFAVKYANGTSVSLGGGGGSADTGNITFSDTTMTSTNGNVTINFDQVASPAVEFRFTESGDFIAGAVKAGSVRGTSSQTAFVNADNVGMAIDSYNQPTTIDIGDKTSWDFVRLQYGTGTVTGNDGDVEIMSMPMGSPAEPSSISISPQGGQNGSFTFGGDGILTLPQYNQIESVGSNATISLNGVGTNESIIELSTRVDGEMVTSVFAMHPAYGIQLTSVRNVDITAGYDSATFKYDAWQAAEALWVEVRDQDAQLIAPGTRTWAGMPSYEAYPLLMDFIQNIPGGEIPPTSNMAPTALTAKSAYELWQVEQAAINVTITAKDQTWTFNNDGTLTVPGTVTSADRLTLNSVGVTSEYTAAVLADGNLGRVFLRTLGGSGATLQTWEFNKEGKLILPNGGDIVDSGGQSVLGGGSGGTTLPADASGYLNNNGSGTLSWVAGNPTGSGMLPYNGVTVLSNTVTADWAEYTLSGTMDAFYDWNSAIATVTLSSQTAYGKEITVNTKNLWINDSKINSNDYLVVEFPATPSVGDVFSVPVVNILTTVNAGSFVVGETYTIVSVGTTAWTSIGATYSGVGQSFVATGIGSGTGTATTTAGAKKLVFKPASGHRAQTMAQGQLGPIIFGQGGTYNFMYVDLAGQNASNPLTWVYAGLIGGIPTWYQFYF